MCMRVSGGRSSLGSGKSWSADERLYCFMMYW